MAAMGQVQPHHRIARFQQSLVDGIVGIRPGMRLHTRMVTAKQLLHTLNRQILQDVHMLTASVVTSSRITFRIFVRGHRSHGQHDRRAYNVLRSNQFQIPPLTAHFQIQGSPDLLVTASDIVHYVLNHVHCSSSFLVNVICTYYHPQKDS